jgi:hypothetical protein
VPQPQWSHTASRAPSTWARAASRPGAHRDAPPLTPHLPLQVPYPTRYRNPEWKSHYPSGIGLLPRREVTVTLQNAIGKESNQRALASAEDTDGVVGGQEAGVDGAQVYRVDPRSHDYRTLLGPYSVPDLMGATGLSQRTLFNLRKGRVIRPTHKTLQALTRGLTALTATQRLVQHDTPREHDSSQAYGLGSLC